MGVTGQGSGSGRGGGDSSGRGRVLNGRYSLMRDGRFSGNRWEILENESESGEDRRDNVSSRRVDDDDNVVRDRNVEMEERMEEVVEGNREQQEQGGGGGNDGGRKRNLEERSPGAHDGVRVNRRRVNEFEMGKMFDDIVKKMEKDIDSLIEKAPDMFKRELRDGLEIMMGGMKSIMNGVSDGVACERMAREAEEIRTEDKMEKIMKEVKEMKNVNRGMVNDRMEQRVKASEKEMEEKVKIAGCSLKILDFDLREVMEDRAKMVRTVIGGLKADVYPEDRQCYERVMRRTRVVILGKRTTAGTNRGSTVHTVPILLECQNKVDAGDLEAILKRAGYFSTFHWPQEMV